MCNRKFENDTGWMVWSTETEKVRSHTGDFYWIGLGFVFRLLGIGHRRDIIELGFLSIHTTLSSSALLYKEKGYMWFSIFINLVKGWPDKKNR